MKDGKEPFEKVIIEVHERYVPSLIDNLNNRKGTLLNTEIDPNDNERHILHFRVPSRGLLGFRNQLTTETRGTALFRSEFLEYDDHCGKLKR